MNSFKKNIVISLTAIVLLCGAKFAHSAQGSPEKSTKPLFEPNKKIAPANQKQFPAETDPGFNDLRNRTMIAVFVVIILGAAAIYLSKKLLPRFTQLSGKRVRIIETIHLGNRKTIHLLEIGARQLLIGSTTENISMLSDVTGEFDSDEPAMQIENN